jgi:hypothetical protein
MSKYLFLLIMMPFFNLGAADYMQDENTSVFSGRISRLNRVAKMARIKINFENAKYLRKKDRVEFWNETYPGKRCIAYLEGRTNEYLLLKIPNYELCVTKVHVTVGTYLHMYSPDLENALKIGQDLVGILLKKKMALEARLTHYKKEVDGHVEKMDAVNKRYEILRQKLEIEWQKELSALEEDKTTQYMNYKQTQSRLNELEHKLQQYRVHDQNLTEDRWALDPNLYFKK